MSTTPSPITKTNIQLIADAAGTGVSTKYITELFNKFEVNSEIRAYANLIDNISHILSVPENEALFGHFHDFIKYKELFAKLKDSNEYQENKITYAPGIGSYNNPVKEVQKYKIAAFILLPKNNKHPQYEIINILYALIILSILSTNDKTENDTQNIKKAAEKLRRIYQKDKKQNEQINNFSKKFQSSSKFHALCALISSESSLANNDLFKSIEAILHLISIKTIVFSTCNQKQASIEIYADSSDVKTKSFSLNSIQKFEGEDDDKNTEPFDEPDEQNIIYFTEQVELYEPEKDEISENIEDKVDSLILENLKSDFQLIKKEVQKYQIKTHPLIYTDNDYLKYTTKLFNEIERGWLTKSLNHPEHLINKNEVPHNTSTALLVSLSICLNMSYSDVFELEIGEKGDITKDGLYKRKVPFIDDSAKINVENKHLFAKHVHDIDEDAFIYLPLPSIVTKRINEFYSGNNGTTKIKKLLNKTSPYLALDFIRCIRKEYGDRFKPNRIECQLKQYVISIKNDPCITHGLFGKKTERIPVAYYYRSTAINELINTYTKLASEYFKEPKAKAVNAQNTVIGSRQYTDLSKLKKNINDFHKSVKKILLSEKYTLIEKHNIYAVYCMQVLSYTSGHRPVKDMYCFLEDIDLEENIVIINDKVSSSSNKNRVCWFSDHAKKQLEYYLNHLSLLAKHIKSKNIDHQLASNIESLLKAVPANKQPIPLFFLLGDKGEVINLSPKKYLKYLNVIWPYRSNHNRHYLESILHDNNIHRVLIDLHLGHQQIYNHLLGKSTSWTAKECADTLKPVLNEMSKNIIWPLISGMEYKGEIETNDINADGNLDYGYIKRRKTRNENILNLELKINDIVIGEISKHGGVEKYSQSLTNQRSSLKKILSECEETKHLSRRGISIFINKLNDEIRKADIPDLNNVKSLRLLQEEKSPFEDRWLSKYVAGRSLRNEFVSYIAERSLNNPKPNKELMWAEITVSAILISGLFNSEWADYILQAGPRELQKIKKWVYFIDIWIIPPKNISNKNYVSPDWRWQPDSFTRNLVSQLLGTHKNIEQFNKQKTIRHFSEILHKLNIKKNKNPVESLCHKILPFWKYHFPTYLVNIFTSKSTTSPLPQHTLARLCYGKRLPATYTLRDKINTKSLSLSEDDNKKNLTEYLSLVKNAMNNSKSENKSSKKIQLKKLQRKIINIHNEHSFPEIANALSQWIIDMTINGIEISRKPEIDTVDKYFFSIAVPLSVYIGNNSFSDRSEEDISNIYKNVINFNNVSQNLRSSQLYRFNYIVVDYNLSEFDSLDWKEITDGRLSKKLRKVNSNIVTPEEYYHCLYLIKKSDYDGYTKSWISLFLLIGYRFGLRISEIRHLRKQDIQLDRTNIIIQVQKTQEGSAKTFKSHRQVPLIGRLNDEEFKLIESHLKLIGRHNKPYPNDKIFFDPTNAYALLSKYVISNEVHSILRHVIGDNNIRFHHLRHSYLTSHYIGNMTKYGFRIRHEIENKLWGNYDGSVKNTLIHPDTYNMNLFSSLSASAGHSQLSTSISSYIHLLDDISIGYAEQAPLKDIDITELSIITNKNENLLRKKLNSKEKYSAIGTLNKMQIGDTLQRYPFRYIRWSQKIKKLPVRKKISIFDIDQILRIAGIENKSLEQIAYQKCIPINIIIKIIESAKFLESLTNYRSYEITSENENSWFELEDGYYKTNINAEITNVNNLLILIDAFLKKGNNYNQFKLAIESWKNSTRNLNSGNGLIFQTPKDLIDFITGCDFIGYRPSSFRATYSKQISEDKKNFICEKLDTIGITQYNSAKIRQSHNGEREERIQFVKLTLSKNNIPSNRPKKMSSLGHVFFLVSVLLSYSI